MLTSNPETRQERRLQVLALVHLVSTMCMVGLIWTIHFVHYPLFAFVGDAEYATFQAEHVERIGRLLIGPWTVEGFCIAALLAFVARSDYRRLAVPVFIGAVAMAVILGISAFFSAPAHGKLADGFDASVHSDLMLADLFRTLAWTLRGAVAVWIVVLVWTNERQTNFGRDK
jgi:hypothetical protein